MNSLDKGIGAFAPAPGIPHWHLLAEELSLPAAVIYEDRLAHNLRWMQSFIDEYGVKLAPHGKTTMAPALFRRQLDAGAWGITVATAQQALVAFQHDVPRVIIANLLVGRRNLEIVADMLAAGAGRFELVCLVDSADAVATLGRFFRARKQRIDVLLELGPDGGRTGARDLAQESAIVQAIDAWSDAVRLAGVEVYEGVLAAEPEIRAFLQRAVRTVEQLARDGRIARPRPMLSGAGSAWYDVVADEFARVRDAVDVVLRPGCYLTHDVGAYRVAQARIEGGDVARRLGAGLQTALQLWAYVLSVPERECAIVGLGKRDAAFDAGYPEPALRFRPGTDSRPDAAPAHWKVTRMMDQHAFLQISAGDDIRVGDMLAFDISHPCLTFDKWRQLALLDAEYRVIDLIPTFF